MHGRAVPINRSHRTADVAVIEWRCSSSTSHARHCYGHRGVQAPCHAGATGSALPRRSPHGPQHLRALKAVLPAPCRCISGRWHRCQRHPQHGLRPAQARLRFGSELFVPNTASKTSPVVRRTWFARYATPGTSSTIDCKLPTTKEHPQGTFRDARHARHSPSLRSTPFPSSCSRSGSRARRASIRKMPRTTFLASRALPWWAIGTSLIAANISAEQIIGMSGSGYVIGLGIASYEWMAALDAHHRRQVFPADVPEEPHLHHAGVPREALTARACVPVMAIFWLGVYMFVNLTAILWLGATAVHTVAGVECRRALIALALFAGALRALRRTEGGRAHRHRAGVAAGARRPHHQLPGAEQGSAVAHGDRCRLSCS